MASEPFREFREWADEHAVVGLTSERKPAKYVSHSAQFRYWSSEKIREIIQSRNPVTTSAKDVPDYICIFSTLVYIEGDGVAALRYLKEIMHRGFDDASLPWHENLNGRYELFGSTVEGRLVLQKFIDTQWRFYPMPAQPFLIAQPSMPSRVFMPNGKAKPIHNRRVHANQIFPITEDLGRPTDVSRATRRVNVSYMKVHSPSNTLQPSTTTPTIVVFKTYPPGEERTYEDECRGYTAIRDARNSDNILQCLGSFYYVNETGEQFSTIMSELADSGTLRDLFSGIKVPYRIEHIRTMWECFTGALYGLATIHNQISPHGNLCFHQDLKPSNFFLFGPNDEKSPFSYKIKIGDFGSSYSRSANPVFNTENAADKGATRTYGPPETYLSDSLYSKAESSVDMWAIGCIIIEMAVWIIGGKPGLDEFRRQRMDETEVLPQHKRLGRSDCFHDGSDVLESVKGVMQFVEENRRKHDDITPAMVELSLKCILVEQRERLHASQLIPKVHRVLQEKPAGKASESESIIPQSSAPTSPSAKHNRGPTGQHEPHLPLNPWSLDTQNITQSPASDVVTSPSGFFPSPAAELADNNQQSVLGSGLPLHARRPPLGQPEVPRVVPEAAMNPSFPTVSIDQLKEWVTGKKTQNNTELPGRSEAKSLLDGRDFIFLIDNSRHTRKYKDEVKTAVTAFTYLLKDIDRNGIEVTNTSAPYDGDKIKNKTEMSQFVERTFIGEIGSDCMIETALNAILEPIKSKWNQRQGSSNSNRRSRFYMPALTSRNQSSRGVTILIFTNGVWDHSPNGTCGAEKPILSLIESMQNLGIPRTQVSIQFVRLGLEERGIARLKILDDELSKDFDIVDTKPITASIWDILIGSMQAGTDNDIVR